MSETETHIGKLLRIEAENQDKWVKDYLNREGIKMSTYDKTPMDCFRDNCPEFIVHKFGIYHIIADKKYESGDDINYMNTNRDGTIDFVNQFYNGGACLAEMLEEALDKLITP